jgi:g-D-glutamyl-meso-diaminopimelate peptidase
MRKKWVVVLVIALVAGIFLWMTDALSRDVCFAEETRDFSEMVDGRALYATTPFSQGIYSALTEIHEKYPNETELRTIGFSVDGTEILALRIGVGKDKALILGGMHGRETITTILLLDQIQQLLLAYCSSDPYQYGGYQTRKILDDVSLWFVPLLNPDGAEISMNAGKTLKNQELLERVTKGEKNLASWKANLNGVDLNRNFTKHRVSVVDSPGAAFYPGEYPFSQPETKAIRDFTLEQDIQGVLNVHAAGEIIYWDPPYENIARYLSGITGYSLVKPSENTRMSTYDTWYWQTTGRPVITLEIGKGSLTGPIPFAQYGDIWRANWTTSLAFARQIQKAQPIALLLEGEEFPLIHPPVREHSGQVLVPLREVGEGLGAQILWNQREKTASVQLEGSPLYVSEKEEMLLKQGKAYVSLRQLAQALGYQVEWDNYTKSANLVRRDED